MNNLLLDTHVWFWFNQGSPRLPARVRRRIEANAERCWISPISVWELGNLVRRRKLTMAAGLRHWIEAAREAWPYHSAPLTQDVALRAYELPLPYDEPGDRFLAATAIVDDLTLVTLDRDLIDADVCRTYGG